MDAIIAPISAAPPAPHGDDVYGGYTAWVSLGDYSTVAFPVVKVDSGVDLRDVGRVDFVGEKDRVVHQSCELGALLSRQQRKAA